MSNRIRKNIHYLKVLHKSKPSVRKAIIENSNKELVDTICECLHNILKGNVRIPSETYKILKRHQGVVRDLHNKKVGIIKKKKLLIQNGGFLPALLAPIITGIAGSLISNLVG